MSDPSMSQIHVTSYGTVNGKNGIIFIDVIVKLCMSCTLPIVLYVVLLYTYNKIMP
jgi:hypothetical protein